MSNSFVGLLSACIGSGKLMLPSSCVVGLVIGFYDTEPCVLKFIMFTYFLSSCVDGLSLTFPMEADSYLASCGYFHSKIVFQINLISVPIQP